MRQENEDVIMEHPGMFDIDIPRLTKLHNIDDLVGEMTGPGYKPSYPM